jgi:tetratricopeptide (TPR) repeat protein
MNSTLQCLSNTAGFCDYFLSDKYLEEINAVNPLGHKGELAKEFGSLLKSIWQAKTSCVSPASFKRAISAFAPQFAGYQQHDSQELLAFLLDGCHEDVNRVLQKPLTEAVENDGSRPDIDVANEAWQIHLQRNQSVVVDHFQGQLRSEATCLECGRKSVKFDESMYLSVPLPQPIYKQHEIMLMLKASPDSTVKCHPRQYVVDVEIDGTIAELKSALAKVSGAIIDDLYVIEIYQGKHFKDLVDTQPLKDVSTSDIVWAYELPGHQQSKLVQVVQRRKSTVSTWSTTLEKFAYPTFLCMDLNDCSCHHVHKTVHTSATATLKEGEMDRFATIMDAVNMEGAAASQKASELRTEADRSLGAGDYDKAIQLYTTAIDTVASKLPAQTASTAVSAADDNQTVQLYAACLHQRGNARIAHGKRDSDFHDAIKDCDLALAVNDNDAMALHLRARAMQLHTKRDENIRCIRALLWRSHQLQPDLDGVESLLREYTEKETTLSKAEYDFRPQVPQLSVCFHNDVDQDIEVFWMKDADTKRRMCDIKPGEEFGIKTRSGDQFTVELKETGERAATANINKFTAAAFSKTNLQQHCFVCATPYEAEQKKAEKEFAVIWDDISKSNGDSTLNSDAYPFVVGTLDAIRPDIAKALADSTDPFKFETKLTTVCVDWTPAGCVRITMVIPEFM